MSDLQILQQLGKELEHDFMQVGLTKIMEYGLEPYESYWYDEHNSGVDTDYRITKKCVYTINGKGNVIGLNISDFWVDLHAISNFKYLEYLFLADNHITDISFLKDLLHITELNLDNNLIINLSPIKRLSEMKFLSLKNNKINDISPLYKLKNLETLDLRNNPIKVLPYWITEFPKMGIHVILEKYSPHFSLRNQKRNGISLWDNPIEIPPYEFVSQGKAAIKAWFEEQKKTKSIPNTYVKLILTGNTTVGKTSLINFITKQSFTEGEITTYGINQTSWKPTNTNLDINIWDFGGQEYYHSTHQLFFSNNALYLLMFDKQHNCNNWLQTEIDYADKGKVTEELEHFHYLYWLQNIRNLSDKSKILMLQNKVENRKDIIYPDKECFDENLEYKVEDYQATSVLKAYNYYQVNHKFSYEFEEIQKLIISKLNEVKRGEIFEYYLKAKELIETAAQTKPVVSIAEFIEICKPANENIANIITDADGYETEYTAWKLMCVYFHETGVLLYYPDSPTLKEKIFIKPTFVTDTIYKVLNYKVKQAFGRFTFDDAVKSLGNDTVLARDMIELMSNPNFKLIFEYPKYSMNYIAPQYLQDSFDDKILEFATDNMQTIFVLHFTQFLPKFIITQFLVHYGAYQQDIIWKYGLLFKKYNCQAFLQCDFKNQKILFKSEINKAANYLKFEIFNTLRKISYSTKNIEISIDNNPIFYNLEQVLSDTHTFNSFNEMYKKYLKINSMTEQELKAQKDNLELLATKKGFLEKELILTYDVEKKFALQQAISELNAQISKAKENVETSETKIAEKFDTTETPKEKRKIRIFVSYSSRDRELREILVDGLRQHLHHSSSFEFELWTDKQIDIGADWKLFIDTALTESNAAILLVSASFASSGFINREELANFFKRKIEDNYLIMPVLVRDYDFNQFEMLSALNFFKTYNSEYGFTKPIEKHKILPFDKLAENANTTDAQLNTYYKNLADFIRTAVTTFTSRL